MKATGYRPAFAAAVEAVSSNGGPLTPPIMAAIAFIMAEFLDTTYFAIIVAAAVPVVFLSIGLQGHLFKSMSWTGRMLLVAGGLVMFYPSWVTWGLGLVAGAAPILWQTWGRLGVARAQVQKNYTA